MDTRENFVTATEAAKILGFDRCYIGQLCRKGELAGAVKLGSYWVIPRATVEGRAPQKRGRKPKAQRRARDVAADEATFREFMKEVQESGALAAL